MRLLLFAVFLVIGCKMNKADINEQDFIYKANELVLSENRPGIEYFFKISLKNEVREYRITYLGSIKANNGEVLKFLNSTVFTGLYEDSKRASASVYIYSNSNKFKGSYQIGAVWNLPNKVENGKLIFSYNDEHCNQNTQVSFLDSIPRQIFIKCKGESGDLYSFTTGE